MQKHVDNNSKIVLATLAEDGSNANEFFCADVVGNRRFAQNYGGYPRSEIAEINAQASLDMQMNLLQNLQDYSPGYNPNAGKTDAEIMLGHKSKYIQTPSESVRWLEGQIAERDAKRFVESQPKDTIEFSETDNPQES